MLDVMLAMRDVMISSGFVLFFLKRSSSCSFRDPRRRTSGIFRNLFGFIPFHFHFDHTVFKCLAPGLSRPSFVFTATVNTHSIATCDIRSLDKCSLCIMSTLFVYFNRIYMVQLSVCCSQTPPPWTVYQ